MLCPLQKIIYAKRKLYYHGLGLDFDGFQIPLKGVNDQVWQIESAQHLQVITPGRSGTKWLSKVLLDSTDSLICHATRRTLAEPGYLFNQKIISDDEILGAYRNSRSEFLWLSNFSGRYYIDLDCKVSPLAEVIFSHYRKCKFLIMLRDPVSFAKSGLMRGYFIEKDPCAWGHLESSPSLDMKSSNNQELQIYKIGAFWRFIALIADSFVSRNTDRIFTLNVNSIFTDSIELRRLYDWLGFSVSRLERSKFISKKINQSKKNKLLSSFQESLLCSQEFSDFCYRGLSESLLLACGFEP